MHDRPVITLTTDFGYEDPFAGVMKGVILKINPAAGIVDITHGIHPQDIKEAAFTIGMNYRFFPADSIHIVVVDPGVGSERRPVMVLADHHYFIGPDNGVFTHIFNSAGDNLEVIHITADHYFLSSHSPTFQGRDIFAPVAAYFSRGVAMPKFGDPITDYRKMTLPAPVVTSEGVLRGEVIHIDRFGNAVTNVMKEDVERITQGNPERAVRVFLKENEAVLKRFYSEGKESGLSALLNSLDYIELFIYMDSASKRYNVNVGDKVRIFSPGPE